MKFEMSKRITEEIDVEVDFPLYIVSRWVGDFPGPARYTFMRIDGDGDYWRVVIPVRNGDYDYEFSSGSMTLHADHGEYLEFIRPPSDIRKQYTWARCTAGEFYSALADMEMALGEFPRQVIAD